MRPTNPLLRLLCALAFLLPALPCRAADSDALRAAVALESARPAAPHFPRDAFLVRSATPAVALSPDGQQVAYLREQAGHRSLWVLAADGGEPRRLLGGTDARQIDWSHDSRWLLLESPGQLFAVAAAGQGGSKLVATLGGREQRELLRIDPSQPAAVLLRERAPATLDTAERWRLVRVDLQGHRTPLREDPRQLVDVALEGRGRTAFVERVEGAALVFHRVDATGDLHEVLRCTGLHRCAPLPLTDAQGRLLLRSDRGDGLEGLRRLEPEGTLTTLHEDPRGEADLDTLALDPANGRPRIASYRSTVAASHALDGPAQRALKELQARYPGRNLEIAIGATHWLIEEQASTLQGARWHLYDVRSGALRDILAFAPVGDRQGRPAQWLPEAAMPRKLPIEWTASDGMRLHGFVWLPPGLDPRRLPLVTLVHGGPWNASRPDEFGGGFVQALVDRGYAVFEPNFRGSTGLGRSYSMAAQGDFGNGRVQQDIVEGTRWLLAHGVGDAGRVGIVGASFGGYSTLLGVTFQPQLFKVGVAMVPPPDFAWVLQWVGRTTEALELARYVPFDAWLAALSLDPRDAASMARLHAQSPLAHARQMNRPLLLYAGGEDRRVAIRGVTGYAARLKQLGKDVSLLVDADAGHSNADPVAREAQLYLIVLMLHRHLGGDAPEPPDPEMRRYLARSLRMAGSDLRAAGLGGLRP
ncbi:S9 family peptidase [Dyella sp.]|jgi:dipeptidyl aminopeptidase/acylaminoacyl peptidase|uniref:S9 family peptidase n=1 Tax=Dyella sp. TaxID=1869338 RepID=UPI002D78F71A|nr:prolyl oligopeptidase family serine peptidase [Dyella sp.]HET6431557.1 prolyl oligopeptidase family serine peptidase [Dyella sp.]